MNFEQYLKQELENDVALREEFNNLQPEYEIISKLIEARLEFGLTQKELAKKCGIKQSNISRLESGKSNPTIKFLQKIASALDAELFIEFRKKTYSSESIVKSQETSPVYFTLVGVTCPPLATYSTRNEYKTTKNHLIKACI